jgi:hypothetical protein
MAATPTQAAAPITTAATKCLPVVAVTATVQIPRSYQLKARHRHYYEYVYRLHNSQTPWGPSDSPSLSAGIGNRPLSDASCTYTTLSFQTFNFYVNPFRPARRACDVPTAKYGTQSIHAAGSEIKTLNSFLLFLSSHIQQDHYMSGAGGFFTAVPTVHSLATTRRRSFGKRVGCECSCLL